MRDILKNKKGEAHIKTALIIIISVVVGALLLGGLYMLFAGKEKYLVNKNVITTWAIVVIDEVRGYKKELDSIKTSFEEKTDLEIPRRSMPFEITCGKAKILYDPDAYEFL